MRDHVVAKGETLGGIAARYGTTWQEVAAANKMRNANLIQVGQRLQVPERGGTRAPTDAVTKGFAKTVPPTPARAPPGREGTTNLFLEKLMEFGDQQAKADFEAGKRVVVALRLPTNHRQNLNGQYDKIAVLRKLSDGTVQSRSFDGSTGPAGAYAHGHARAAKESHTDMTGDGRMDLGRLIVGNYRYRKREGNFMGAVAFRATRTQVAERDTNQDGSFDGNDRNRIDRTGMQRSILIHRGGSERFTGSAACQTIKPSQHPSFLSAIASVRNRSSAKSSCVVNSGRFRFILAAVATLGITACSGTKETEAVAAANGVTSNSISEDADAPQTAGAGVEPPTATLNQQTTDAEAPGEEAPQERVKGRWRVVDAAGPEGGMSMIGRTLSFTDEALGWVGKDGKVASDCRDPFFHVITEAAEVRSFSTAFKAGWAKFRLPPGDVGAMHAWECGDGKSVFGPREPAAGSVFFPIGTDGLVMNWHDGAVLLLRR